MINILDKKDCCGCSACVQRCPKHCIAMREDNEGFLYPEVNKNFCINCGLCEKVCPVINQATQREPLKVYAAKNPDEEIRRQSSSGGIFTMLAERIIDNDGVVFGASFDKNWDVEHQYTEIKEGLAAFRGSKYVQSRINDAFKQTETFLKQGREVLFSGTPCQIAGLKLFLRKEYDNLLTVDFICHGVPSPGVWRTYLKETIMRPEGATGKNTVLLSLNSMPVITGISFRDKRLGWKKFGFGVRCAASKAAKNSVLESDKSQEETFLYQPMRENPFLRGFLANLFLRPSCYSCPTKELKSGSDITIADFWGVEDVMQDFFDDKGVSLVFVNTQKGKKFYVKLNDINCKETNIDSVRQYNSALTHSPKAHHKRKLFYEKFSNSKSISDLIISTIHISVLERVYYIIKQLIRRL